MMTFAFSLMLFDQAIKTLAIVIRGCEDMVDIWKDNKVSLCDVDLLAFSVSNLDTSVSSSLQFFNSLNNFSGHCFQQTQSSSGALGLAHFPFRN